MRNNILFYIMALFLVLYIPSISFSQVSLEEGMAELSKQIASKASQQHKTTIAVIEFSDLQGIITDLGRFLAEELITRLYSTEKFKVIERLLLNRVISEQKLNLSGIVDPKSARELGKLLGVDAIVSGTITDLVRSVRINARLISTQTGEIFAVASTEILKDDAIMNLIGQTGGTITSGAPTSKKIEINSFVFEILACYREAGRRVICEILITNKGRSQELSVYAHYRSELSARMLDEYGNEYLANIVRFGNSESQNEVRKKVASDLGVKATFQFNNIPTELKTIPVLELGLWTTEPWHAKFRNIAIKGTSAGQNTNPNKEPLQKELYDLQAEYAKKRAEYEQKKVVMTNQAKANVERELRELEDKIESLQRRIK